MAASKPVGRAVRQINRLLLQTPSGEGYAHLAEIVDLVRGDLGSNSADVIDNARSDIGRVWMSHDLRWVDLVVRGRFYRIRTAQVKDLVRAHILDAPVMPHPFGCSNQPIVPRPFQARETAMIDNHITPGTVGARR